MLARGNLDLVEESLIKSLKKERGPWWKFWYRGKWVIDFQDAANYIVKAKETPIDNLEIKDDGLDSTI